MAHIRTKKELYERELTPAEEQLIEACQKGEGCILGDGELPPEGTPHPSRHTRADVLRYLIKGGCAGCKVDDIGVALKGAHVTGTLDLDFVTTRGAIRMPNSRFEECIYCEQTKCRQLMLNGSDLQGLRGEAMKVTGSVFLREITTNATVYLNSATICGQLSCRKATFEVKEGFALTAQGADITAGVVLAEITTNAKIALNSAKIGGQLNCEKAIFEVEEGEALNAQSAKMNGGLFWRGVTVTKGTLYFANAHTSVLSDDESSWPSGGRVDLNGMTYDTIIGGPLDSKSRLAWLHNVSNWNGTFTPQPYTQLAKVLRDMGHDNDARQVLEKRDALLLKSYRKNLRKLSETTKNITASHLATKSLAAAHWLFVDKLMGTLTGYGHQPFRSLRFLFLLIGLAAIPSHMAWTFGGFAPNSAVIQVSDDWKALSHKENAAEEWSAKTQAGRDWETFQAIAYATDLVIPIINIGQTDTWAPSTTRGAAGYHMWWLSWVFTIVGWIVTALGAAAITGVIRRD